MKCTAAYDLSSSRRIFSLHHRVKCFHVIVRKPSTLTRRIYPLPSLHFLLSLTRMLGVPSVFHAAYWNVDADAGPAILEAENRKRERKREPYFIDEDDELAAGDRALACITWLERTSVPYDWQVHSADIAEQRPRCNPEVQTKGRKELMTAPARVPFRPRGETRLALVALLALGRDSIFLSLSFALSLSLSGTYGIRIIRKWVTECADTTLTRQDADEKDGEWRLISLAPSSCYIQREFSRARSSSNAKNIASVYAK